MIREIKIMTIRELYKLYESDKIDFNFECFDGIQSQRGFVWKPKESSLFIDSILRNMSIGSCCATIIDGDMSIMDGKQRLLSIMKYIDNDYALSLDLKDVNGFEIKKCKFNDLDNSLQEAIYDRQIIFEIVSIEVKSDEDENEQEIKSLIENFVRLNKGVKLTNTEIYKAQLGKKITFLNEMLEKDFFKVIATKANDRGQLYDIAMGMLMLETNNNTGLTKKEKDAFIETVNQFKEFSDVITKGVMKKLDYLDNTFNNEKYLSLTGNQKYLKKTHINQLYILTKSAMANKISPEAFIDWANPFFATKKDVKNDYWISAVKDSSTSTVQKKAKILKKVFNKNFKIK